METSEPVDTSMVEKSKLDEDSQGKVVDPISQAYQKALTCTFADANHAGCQDTQRSTTGSMQILADRLVSWSSKKQKSTAISSIEAEYIALNHFIKEQVKNGVVELYFVRTEYQLADIFTKAFGRERLDFLINKLRMRSMSPETLKKNRVQIGKCNMRIDPIKTPKEPTYQVVLNALTLTTYYPAFLITAEFPEIYMHQFWHTITKIKNSSLYKFKLDKKKCTIDAEVFRDILQICHRLTNQEFVVPL
ncbi:hypothetical protein Tco_1172713 [Tanacetum coccineum]